MLSLSLQHRPRSFRSGLPQMLVLALSLALGACDSAESPLNPAEDPAAPATEPVPAEAVASDNALALITSQRIAFTSTRNGGYDIYKMDTQGNNVAPLATSADLEWAPAWSYDNKRVALSRPRKDASNFIHYDIWLIDADGSNGHWARINPLSYDFYNASWSPNGTRLVLNLTISGALYVGWLDLATGQVGVFSGGLEDGLQGQKPSYSSTGQYIVYLGPTGKTINRINADGSGLKTLVSSTNLLSQPALSPNGKKLAFVKAVGTYGTNWEVFVKNFADGTTKRLTTWSGDDIQPTWSPDGSKIAFTSSRSGMYQIWTVSATGGSPTRITHTSTSERDPAWSH
jgi:Tol biopolymer transport system component